MSRLIDELQQTVAGGPDAVLDRLIEGLRSDRKYHELFEALKMRVRRQLDLPLLFHDTPDDLDEARRNQFEDGLLSACREVGLLLLADGKVREGWMYLRPVGDRAAASNAIEQIAASAENAEELIEVCLNEGVDVRRGFQLLLEHYGTCQAITTFESTVGRQSRPVQQSAAGQLVRHIHGELMRNVAADIARHEGSTPAAHSLQELIANRDWLFGEYSYHLDTTHLASTVRIARVLDDPEGLQLALDVTAYGSHLAKQFHYKGEEPFGDIYPSHALYFSARLGQKTEEAVQYFRERAESLSVAEHGSLPLESYVQLLDCLGRYSDAMDCLMDYAEREQRPKQVVPLLMDLAGKLGDYSAVGEFCRRHDDVLGFGTALAHQRQLDEQVA